ncbi:hypothetical protein EMIHUDRAFT_199980 [Emiliania huxleyi CCMP1516]|uniref:Anaphase-promoting complex subunit 4 WD40 domain-containing protein n=2 Tax=Emiliania huxleyi TaxID=2903 RepID=A0A0D3KUR6_EMIH1|nr:hypothetical protein EMIHUDRAFT_199980 [Emiliania huxleyi CCMP1516]EOD39501.1 hypothetical protein EMIHUDRAFT_199980 [Emiliania huxleyi CCMP1516]|eukprot:XP_005791930.1 hypothetical protein EMIHUDRAFT_199980 [Emiliania huxleyi CCMP1516]
MLRASESGAAVTAIAFSPDGSRLAAATADGMLVLWSVGGDCSGRPAAEGEGSSGEGEPQLLARLASYFGGLLCVAWARDGANESVIDGDCLQDDLVSVVSFERRAVVARAQGHSSWVHHVAFEPAPLQEGKDRPPASHAFASVGADGRICFWEFRADGKGEDGGGPPPNGADVPLLAPLASVPLHERPVAALLYGRGEMHTACAGGFVKTFARVS